MGVKSFLRRFMLVDKRALILTRICLGLLYFYDMLIRFDSSYGLGNAYFLSQFSEPYLPLLNTETPHRFILHTIWYYRLTRMTQYLWVITLVMMNVFYVLSVCYPFLTLLALKYPKEQRIKSSLLNFKYKVLSFLFNPTSTAVVIWFMNTTQIGRTDLFNDSSDKLHRNLILFTIFMPYYSDEAIPRVVVGWSALNKFCGSIAEAFLSLLVSSSTPVVFPALSHTFIDSAYAPVYAVTETESEKSSAVSTPTSEVSADANSATTATPSVSDAGFYSPRVITEEEAQKDVTASAAFYGHFSGGSFLLLTQCLYIYVCVAYARVNVDRWYSYQDARAVHDITGGSLGITYIGRLLHTLPYATWLASIVTNPVEFLGAVIIFFTPQSFYIASLYEKSRQSQSAFRRVGGVGLVGFLIFIRLVAMAGIVGMQMTLLLVIFLPFFQLTSIFMMFPYLNAAIMTFFDGFLVRLGGKLLSAVQNARGLVQPPRTVDLGNLIALALLTDKSEKAENTEKTGNTKKTENAENAENTEKAEKNTEEQENETSDDEDDISESQTLLSGIRHKQTTLSPLKHTQGDDDNSSSLRSFPPSPLSSSASGVKIPLAVASFIRDIYSKNSPSLHFASPAYTNIPSVSEQDQVSDNTNIGKNVEGDDAVEVDDVAKPFSSPSPTPISAKVRCVRFSRSFRSYAKIHWKTWFSIFITMYSIYIVLVSGLKIFPKTFEKGAIGEFFRFNQVWGMFGSPPRVGHFLLSSGHYSMTEKDLQGAYNKLVKRKAIQPKSTPFAAWKKSLESNPEMSPINFFVSSHTGDFSTPREWIKAVHNDASFSIMPPSDTTANDASASASASASVSESVSETKTEVEDGVQADTPSPSPTPDFPMGLRVFSEFPFVPKAVPSSKHANYTAKIREMPKDKRYFPREVYYRIKDYVSEHRQTMSKIRTSPENRGKAAARSLTFGYDWRNRTDVYRGEIVTNVKDDFSSTFVNVSAPPYQKIYEATFAASPFYVGLPEAVDQYWIRDLIEWSSASHGSWRQERFIWLLMYKLKNKRPDRYTRITQHYCQKWTQWLRDHPNHPASQLYSVAGDKLRKIVRYRQFKYLPSAPDFSKGVFGRVQRQIKLESEPFDDFIIVCKP